MIRGYTEGKAGEFTRYKSAVSPADRGIGESIFVKAGDQKKSCSGYENESSHQPPQSDTYRNRGELQSVCERSSGDDLLSAKHPRPEQYHKAVCTALIAPHSAIKHCPIDYLNFETPQLTPDETTS